MSMPAVTKIDLFKLNKRLYVAPNRPVFLEVPPATYLALEGVGAPGGEEFTARIQALYGMAFTIKMSRKFAGQEDYGVCKLEAQWWAKGSTCFTQLPQAEWRWKLLIRTPEFIGTEDLKRAREVLVKRGKGADTADVRLEELTEGACVQMLHTGPYDREGETVAVMRAAADKAGLGFEGRHHEIYLSDPRRVAPEKLRTILRQPVRPSA